MSAFNYRVINNKAYIYELLIKKKKEKCIFSVPFNPNAGTAFHKLSICVTSTKEFLNKSLSSAPVCPFINVNRRKEKKNSIYLWHLKFLPSLERKINRCKWTFGRLPPRCWALKLYFLGVKCFPFRCESRQKVGDLNWFYREG